MRKAFTSGLGLALVLFGAGAAIAGDYHSGASLVCTDCHVMHYSQAHDYTTDGSGTIPPIGGGGPYQKLLRNTSNALCLSCHNAQTFAPDVLGAQTGSVVRQAGALNEQGGEGLDPTGHTLGSSDAAPGSSPSWNNPSGLSCVDCHAQHGTTNYRNLLTDPGNGSGLTITYATGTNNQTLDVFQNAALNYSYTNVWLNEPTTTASAFADWCKGCHTNWHGAKGGAEVGGATGVDWIRHPNADADIGDVGDADHSSLARYAGLTNKVKTMSETGIWTTTTEADLLGATPTCISCHKAHGNGNPFGLIFMSGTGTVDEEGDDGTQARDLCRQCHVQGA